MEVKRLKWVILGVLVIVLVLILFSWISAKIRFTRATSRDRLLIQIRALYGLVRKTIEVPIQYDSMLQGLIVEKNGAGAGTASQKSASADSHKGNAVTDTFTSALNTVKRSLPRILLRTDWLKDTMCRVHCTRFNWRSRVGLPGAVDTAIAAGIGWGIKSSVIGFMFQYIRLDVKPQVMIEPRYTETVFTTELACEVKIRFIHMLTAGIRFMVRVVKLKKPLRRRRNVLSRA
jgi:hypothetical protein